MPLTPADVHNVAFSKPPIGKRGYNEDEVDQFLDLVEDTLAQLQEENEDLHQRVRELKDSSSSASAGAAASRSTSSSSSVDEAALRREIESELRSEYEDQLTQAKKATQKAEADIKTAREEADRAKKEAAEAKRASAASSQQAQASSAVETSTDSNVQAAKVLGMAQEMADRLTTEAQMESKSMLDEARQAAEKQIGEADRKARNLVADAEKKSEETLAAAHSRAETQVRQAEEKAAALKQDAERKHSEIMSTVKQQQTALESRIAELRTFEREYRTRLKTMLQSQLEELESRGSTVTNSEN